MVGHLVDAKVDTMVGHLDDSMVGHLADATVDSMVYVWAECLDATKVLTGMLSLALQMELNLRR